MGILKTLGTPGAGLVGSLVGQGVNAYIQGQQNKKARKWAEKRYGVERADALSDWNMQNQYDSPEAQMARFRAAGLNPNMIYGQMSEGQTVRSTDSKSWNPQAPGLDVGGAIGQYQQTRLQNSQMDLLQKNMELLDIEKLVKLSNVSKNNAQTAGYLSNNQYLDGTLKERIAKAAADLKATQAGIGYTEAATGKVGIESLATYDANERANAMQAGNLEQQMLSIAKTKSETKNIDANTRLHNQSYGQNQRMNPLIQGRMYHELAQMRKNIENAGKDGTLKDFEIKLNEAGFTKNDPTYWRILSKAVSNMGSSDYQNPEQQKKMFQQLIDEAKNK